MTNRKQIFIMAVIVVAQLIMLGISMGYGSHVAAFLQEAGL